MENQLTLFDFIRPEISIDKPIRLIELFAGYGSQALALEYLGVDFEHYRAVEFDKYAIASYNAVHNTDFPVMDVTKIKGDDLGIISKSEFTYLLTYLLVSLYGPFCCWTDERNGRGFWNKIKPIVGSQEIA